MKDLSLLILLVLISYSSINAQAQYEVESNSSSSAPQLLLNETENNDFVRLWFQNDGPDKWAFNAKPAAGTSDNANILSSPIIFAYNGAQIFGIGANGTVRVNKAYTLPNADGQPGQVLTTDGAGITSWSTSSGGGSSVWQSIGSNIYRSSGNVGIGTNDPDVKLEVDGALRLGFEEPSSPVAGTMRWNPNVNDFEGYDGSQWRSLTTCGVTGISNTGGVNSQPMCCEEYHVASDIGSGSLFGRHVDIYGDYAVVTDGKQTMYIFEYDGSNWTEVLKVRQPNIDNLFGSSVAIYEDWIVVGASRTNDEGQVHVFKNTNGLWAEHSTLSPTSLRPEGLFGYDCAIYGDYMIASAPDLDVVYNHSLREDQGAVYLFQNINDVWTEIGQFTIDDSTVDTHFGSSIDISHQHIVVGSEVKGSIRTSSTGKAYVYKRLGTSWGLETILGSTFVIDARYGKSVAVDNETMVIGASNTGNGNDGSPKLGRAYIYNYENNNWNITDTLEAQTDNDFFGSSVDIAGDYIMVGKRSDVNGFEDAGAVEVFHYNNGWTYNRSITDQLPGEDADFGCNDSGIFGNKTATDGVNFIIGAHKANANGLDNSGRVVFGPID